MPLRLPTSAARSLSSGCRGAGHSEAGSLREHNEDALCIEEELGFFAIADGVGGRAKGEMASAAAVDTAVAHVRVWRHHNPGVPFGRDVARRAVEHAGCEVHQLGREAGERDGMASTLLVVLVHGARAFIAHVGDTRAYLVGKRVHQITTDHTLVADLVATGVVEPRAAATHPHRSVLTRALGPTMLVPVDAHEVVVPPGERLVLCSDGAAGVIESSHRDGVLSWSDLRTAAVEVVRRVKAAGGADDATVAVIDPWRSATAGRQVA